MPRYNPATIEPKWQAYWEKHQTFAAPRMPKPGTKKLYALDMFPYPSGDGLHVGHPEGYTATDIVCRAARMQGKSVMHPMGFDAFGLPAEEHAIKTGEHPRTQTEKNIDTFRRQLKSLGFSYDWSRELATTDVEYVRWTQWIFLQIYDTWFDQSSSTAGRSASCRFPPTCRTRRRCDPHVSGRASPRLSERSAGELVPRAGHRAGQRRSDQRQERTRRPPGRADAAAAMDAPHHRLRRPARKGSGVARLVRRHQALQRNWIGRSTGAEVDFYIGGEAEFAAWQVGLKPRKSGFPRKPDDDVLRIYTTRPDTLFGATYMVIAPEHPFVERLTRPTSKRR